MREGFRRELQPVPGVIEAPEEIDLPTCIASSGSHEKMRFTLSLTGLAREGARIFDSMAELPALLGVA